MVTPDARRDAAAVRAADGGGRGADSSLVVCAQLATTRLGISLDKLAPDFKRLNSDEDSDRPGAEYPAVPAGAGAACRWSAWWCITKPPKISIAFLELPWMGAASGARAHRRRPSNAAVARRRIVSSVGLVDLVWQRTATPAAQDEQAGDP